MLTWCVSTMLLISAQDGAKLQPPPAASKDDAASKLKERASKLGAATSYSFESTVESEGGGFGGPPGGGRGGAPGGGAGGAPGGGGAGAGGGTRTDTTSGKVEIGKTAELKRGETLAYRIGTKLVYKKGDAWELYTPPDFGGGFGGGPPGGGPPGGGAPGGGAPGGAPPGGGAPAGGVPGGGAPGGGGDFRERFALMGLANAVLPHELLSGMDSKIKDVQCAEADGKCTFTGALTDAAADEFSGAKRMREMAERFGGGAGGGAGGAPASGGGASTVTASGTATVVYDKNGSIERVVIETKTTSPRGDSKRKQTIAFKDWNKSTVEMPKDAASKVTG